MKKYINLILLGVLVISFGIYYAVKNISWNEVKLLSGYYDEKITIMNTADIHGHLRFEDNAWGQYTTENIYGVMGMPLVKAMFESEKASDPNTLIVDSGDMFHGTNEANVEQGKGVLEVANMMGYTAMVPGSNDFNFGFDRLMEIQSQLDFPMIAANVYKDRNRLFKPYVVQEVLGKKIAFIGLLTPSAQRSFSTEHQDEIQITDPVEEAKRLVDELKESSDVIVLLSHLGDDADVALAGEVQGIDLILSGRKHNLYTHPVRVGKTWIAEAGAWTTHVGYATLYFNKGELQDISWNVRSLSDGSRGDAAMMSVVEKYYQMAMEETKEVVGTSSVELDGTRTSIRTRETNFANVLTDAMKERSQAEIAIINGGGIRESISAGEINLYQLNRSLPFSNTLVVAEVAGDRIYKAIERGLNAYPNGTNGAFLQVSGIRYAFDASRPAGKRVTSVTFNDEPLDFKRKYKVALSDYLYNGGDNFEEFKDASLLSVDELLMNVLADYLRKHKVIEPGMDGRIQVTNQRYE